MMNPRALLEKAREIRNEYADQVAKLKAGTMVITEHGEDISDKTIAELEDSIARFDKLA